MAKHNGPLEAVDCHIHSEILSYPQREIRYADLQKWASSGHLRRCSDADTSNKYLSRREIRYVRQQRNLGVSVDLIRSPTPL
eukprot:scaffold28661_cov161-Skeletonema_marinoi.AAC.1